MHAALAADKERKGFFEAAARAGAQGREPQNKAAIRREFNTGQREAEAILTSLIESATG